MKTDLVENVCGQSTDQRQRRKLAEVFSRSVWAQRSYPGVKFTV